MSRINPKSTSCDIASYTDAQIPTPTQQHAAAVRAARDNRDEDLYSSAIPEANVLIIILVSAAFGWIIAILGLLWLAGWL